MNRSESRPRLTFRGCRECAVWLLRGSLIAYLLICTACAAFQRRLIYFPPKFTSAQVDQLARNARLERWENPAGQAIGMKRLSPRQPAEGQVLVV